MGCGSSGLGDQVLVAEPKSLRPVACPQDGPTQEAVALFNGGDAKAALAALGLEANPKAAARWLHRTQGLDCVVLGDVLGDLAYSSLRQAYIQAFTFTGLDLETALRSLLCSFKLPGEAQKIDRLMECFASHWCACHKEGILENVVKEPQLSPDGAYLISFALIMLNTDLHNISVKRKMSLEQFQRAVRSADGGQELPKSWIRKLYRSIRDNAIKMECTFTSPMPNINPEAFDDWLENLPAVGDINLESDTEVDSV